MSTTNRPRSQTGPTCLDLSRAEAWVVHHVALSALTDDGESSHAPQPWWALETAQKLEAGVRSFTQFEGWRLRVELLAYAADLSTPDGDAAVARTVGDRLERSFAPAPPAIENDMAVDQALRPDLD
ncbi:DUF7853 family protein [Haloarchaeobius iranensis]|uniref:Uncharacterized protein n=1 Tax=Haloarchaeobius iranensis TaxID=996166 RepID=A0A1G9T838_9EURY|nr:hypothetical protein [Haloarchaeobius iranensis]SDM43834.1 hypothetical protein SAMN05192554_102192 [Haloarchaeobius iranensis]